MFKMEEKVQNSVIGLGGRLTNNFVGNIKWRISMQRCIRTHAVILVICQIFCMEFDDLDTARSWAVLAACFLTLVVNGGTNYSVGLIHRSLLDRYGRSNAVTSWVGSLHSSLFSLASPLSSVLIDKGSCRIAIITSGLLFTIGYIGTAFAPTLEVAIVTCSVSGVGGASCYAASLVAQEFNFRRFRNFAQGVALSGIGVGIFVLAPIMQVSMETYGNAGFFIILASISIQLIVFGTLVKPSKLEKRTQLKRKLQSVTDSKNIQMEYCKCILLKSYIRVLMTKPITFLSFGMFLFHCGAYIVFMNLPNYCVHHGFSEVQSSFLLSVCGVASIICRLLTGVAANSVDIDKILLYSGSMGILSLATCLFPFFSKYYCGQLAYAVILGMYFGSPYVLVSTINLQYVGISNVAAAVGLELCFGGIGALIGPVFTGLLLDRGTSYDQIFLFGGLTLLLAALCSLSSTLFAPGDKKTTDIVNTNIEIVIPEQSLTTDKDEIHELMCRDPG